MVCVKQKDGGPHSTPYGAVRPRGANGTDLCLADRVFNVAGDHFIHRTNAVIEFKIAATNALVAALMFSTF